IGHLVRQEGLPRVEDRQAPRLLLDNPHELLRLRYAHGTFLRGRNIHYETCVPNAFSAVFFIKRSHCVSFMIDPGTPSTTNTSETAPSVWSPHSPSSSTFLPQTWLSIPWRERTFERDCL